MFGVNKFFCKEINTFSQQGYIKLIKSDSKDINNVFQINAALLNLLFIKESQFPQIVSSATVFNISKLIINVSPNQYIRMVLFWNDRQMIRVIFGDLLETSEKWRNGWRWKSNP